MGNSTSVPTDDSSDFHSIPYASDPLQTPDDLNPSSSPTAYTLDPQARHELRLQLFKRSSHDLQDLSSSTQPMSLPAHPNVMGKPDRVDISEALAVLQQFRQSASPQQLLELQNALLPTGSRTAPTSPSASQSEVISPRPGQPEQLIRRKSYFTPGVATREKGNKLQKRPTSTRQPSSKSVEQHAWSPDMFGQSPLSKLAGWESKNDGLSERAITPDISQSYLGTYALGSLRVTNGVASPAPSVYSKLVSKTSQSSLKRHEDFYTASEGSENDVADKPPSKPIMRSSRSGRPLESETTHMKEHVTRPKHWQGVPEFQESTSYTDSLQNSSPADPGVTSDMLHNSSEPEPSDDLLTRSPSVLKPYQHELNSNPFLDSTSNQQIPQIEDGIESPAPSPYKTSPVLLYQNEANSNPFLATEGDEDIDLEHRSELTLSSSAEASAPSFNDGFQNRLFQANSQAMRKPLTSKSDFELEAAPRIEAFRRLNEQSNREYEMFSAASSIYTAGSRRETKHPDITSKKHDSGYGSEASRQNSKDTLVPQTASAPCSSFPSPAEERDDPTSASMETTIHRKPGHPPQLKSALSSKQREQVDVTKPLPQTPPAAVSSNPIEAALPSLRPQSTPNLLLPSSPASDPSTDTPKPASGPRKLQKKRPRSQKMNSEPLIVQTQPTIEDPRTKFPQIPAHISERHAERLNLQPKMDHLERTYKSITHEKSHESFHSSEPYNVPIRFPSPTRGSDSTEGKERKPNYRRSSFAPENLQSFFRRGERSKSGSGPRPQEIANVDIADFGTVTGSLGSSPYDMAYPTGHHERRGRVPALGASRHPHQMGYHESIAKSTTGMTDEMASQFAQRRSRDRYERAYETDQSEQRPKQRSMSSRLEDHSELRSSRTHRDRSTPAQRDDHQLRRPKSWYATGAPEAKDGTVHVKRAHPVADVASESLPTRQPESSVPVSNNFAASEHEADWGASARAWRLRRKSLGENLRTHATQDLSKSNNSNARSPLRRPQTPHQQASTPPHRSFKRPVPVYAATAATSQARESPPPVQPVEKLGQRTKAEEAPEPPRASSPTPSVRERAAAYERGIGGTGSPDRQSPTRRPPSSLKSSAYNIRTPEQLPPARSKFSTTPHSAASPSGVASAYTVSENVSSMDARKPETVPTLFQRPVDLSPPKRRGTNITRRPVGTLASSHGH